VTDASRPSVAKTSDPTFSIRFPVELLERIDTERGSGSRTAWLRAAAEEKLSSPKAQKRPGASSSSSRPKPPGRPKAVPKTTPRAASKKADFKPRLKTK
jgi:hypothetical protein